MEELISSFFVNIAIRAVETIWRGRSKIFGEIESTIGTSRRGNGQTIQTAFDADVLIRVSIETKRSPVTVRKRELTFVYPESGRDKQCVGKRIPVEERFAQRYIPDELRAFNGDVFLDTPGKRVTGFLRFIIPEIGSDAMDGNGFLYLRAIDSRGRRHKLPADWRKIGRFGVVGSLRDFFETGESRAHNYQRLASSSR
jgi:hypothetical protein